jgi:hypothetical protein
VSSQLPADIRQLVAERAGFRCEYCLIPNTLTFAPHEIDHVIALKHGGRSTLDNLAYSCAVCNKRKGSDVASYDSLTDRVVPLYHPRRDRWAEHFRLDGPRIVPLSPRGRVTVELLRLNRASRIAERSLLLEAGTLEAPE